MIKDIGRGSELMYNPLPWFTARIKHNIAISDIKLLVFNIVFQCVEGFHIRGGIEPLDLYQIAIFFV